MFYFGDSRTGLYYKFAFSDRLALGNNFHMKRLVSKIRKQNVITGISNKTETSKNRSRVV